MIATFTMIDAEMFSDDGDDADATTARRHISFQSAAAAAIASICAIFMKSRRAGGWRRTSQRHYAGQQNAAVAGGFRHCCLRPPVAAGAALGAAGINIGSQRCKRLAISRLHAAPLARRRRLTLWWLFTAMPIAFSMMPLAAPFHLSPPT